VSYPETKVFFLEPTGRMRRYARCFVRSSSEAERHCAVAEHGYHQAWVLVDEVPEIRTKEGYIEAAAELPEDAPWPRQCPCGRLFLLNERQTFTDRIYRRTDTGEEMTLRDAGPGAMWDADWMGDFWKGPDGRCLVVKCPNGREWMIDSRASNCTSPIDNEHKCWIRHGEPPNITVDKNGKTCAAGAGSIQAGDYHGFLRNGILTAG